MREMLKRILAIIFMVSFTVGFPPPAMGAGGILDEGFDSGSFISAQPGGKMAATKFGVFHQGNVRGGFGGKSADDYSYVIKTAAYDGTPGYNDPYMDFTASQAYSGIYTMSASVCMQSDAALRMEVPYIKTGGGTAWYNPIVFSPDLTVRTADNVVRGQYLQNTWYDISVIFNTEAKNVKVYLGALLVREHEIADLDAVNRFKLAVIFSGASPSAPKSGVAAVDNLKMYQGDVFSAENEAEKFIGENFDRLDNGRFVGTKNFSSVVKTGAAIEVAEGDAGNVLRISLSSASDSYIQSGSGSYGGMLFVKSRIKVDGGSSGSFSVVLRDDNPNSVDGSMQLAKISGSSITYLEDLAPTTKAYTSGTYVDISVLINVRTGNIKVYNENTLEAECYDYKEIGAYTGFNFEHVAARWYARRSGGTFTAWLDDVYVANGTLTSDGTFYSSPGFFGEGNSGTEQISFPKEGNMSVLRFAVKPSGTYKTLMFFTRMNGEELLNIYALKKEISEGVNSLTADFKAENVESEDFIKTMLWEEDILKPLVAVSVLDGKGEEDTEYILDNVTQIIAEKNPGKAHPRLLFRENELSALRIRCSINQTVRPWYLTIKAAADTTLTKPLPSFNYNTPYNFNSAYGDYGMSASLTNLAFAYVIEQDTRYAERVYEIMEHVSQFPTWGTSHFLDVATAVYGASLAYDWCYNYFAKTPERLKLIEDAIAEKGLMMAEAVFRGNPDNIPGLGMWTSHVNNWRFICNSAIAMGALCLGDVEEYEELCAYLLKETRSSLDLVLGKFAPDGAWYEGPGYWAYSMSFLVPYIASLEKSIGTDLDILNTPSMDKTAYYPIQNTGTLYTFNLNDAAEGYESAPSYGYFAKTFGDVNLGRYRYYQLNTLNVKPSFLDILWMESGYFSSDFAAGMPLDGYYRDSEVATFRDGYGSGQRYYAGIHGGKNAVEHGQIDAGTFVYETDGVRWAIDLGKENYNVQSYWTMTNTEKSRWAYYRSRGEGHNTVIVNPGLLADQNLNSPNPIIDFKTDGALGSAIVNMTDALGVISAQRGLNLNRETGELLLVDEINKTAGGNVYWFMHTRAAINISADKKSAVLSQGGKYIKIINLGDGVFSEMAAVPLSTSPKPDLWQGNIAQDKNIGVRKLCIHLTNAPEDVNFAVYMKPIATAGETVTAPAIPSLISWR